MHNKKAYILGKMTKIKLLKIFSHLMLTFSVKEKIKKVLAFLGKTMYNINCCGMIAVKREVAAYVAGFPWSECQVRKLTTSHCTNNMVYQR